MSSRSGRSTAISKRAEKLALAKLKVMQLKKQHQLERKMNELKFEKEMMEAQMEEERAAVSLIYEPDNEEEQNLDYYEEDRLQLRDGAMDSFGLKSVNPIQTSKANRETLNFPKELYVSRGSNTEKFTPSKKQEDVLKYYVEQPTLRQYGQEPPELRQNTAFTEIYRPPLKVLAEEVWSQEAQGAIETDIGPLQTLKDFKGNPEVSSRLSNKEYHSLINSVNPKQPLGLNHLNYGSERQRPLGPNHLNHHSERQQPLGPNHLNHRSKRQRPLGPNHLNYRSERQRPLGPYHLNYRSERQRPLGPNHLNRRSNIFIVM